MTIRRTLLTAAIATSSAVSVHAQQQPTETTQTETVVVTGSRIPRIDAETPSPVQVVSREAIEQAGRQSISEVLRGLVSADNQGSIPTAFSGGFAAGSSAVSPRTWRQLHAGAAQWAAHVHLRSCR
jgi:iron complex outermembrane receptor protein